jgi:hypothetical protein
MLTLPTLPTDNLYKFIFLAGLVLIIYSSYIGEKHLSNTINIDTSLDSLDAIQKSNSRTLDYKIKEAKELTDRIKNNVYILDSLTNANKKKQSIKFKQLRSEVQTDLKTVNEEVIRIKDLRSKFDKQAVSHLNEARKLITSKVYSEFAIKTQYVFFMIGLISFIVGALSWLFIVQRPQDELNKIQLKLAQLELAEKSKKTKSSM